MLRRIKKIAGLFDARDGLGFIGLVLAAFGLETIYRGSGFAVTGLILVAIAALTK